MSTKLTGEPSLVPITHTPCRLWSPGVGKGSFQPWNFTERVTSLVQPPLTSGETSVKSKSCDEMGNPLSGSYLILFALFSFGMETAGYISVERISEQESTNIVLFIKWHTIFLSVYHALAGDSGKLTVPSRRDTTSQTFLRCKSAERPAARPI